MRATAPDMEMAGEPVPDPPTMTKSSSVVLPEMPTCPARMPAPGRERRLVPDLHQIINH